MVAPAVAAGAGATWSLRWKAMLDTASSWVPNMRKVKRDVTSSKVKTKELGNVFDRLAGSMKMVTFAGVGLAAALLGMLTAGIAKSPQFQAMWARLQPIFFRLTNYLGQKFAPAMDKIVELAMKLVDGIIRLDEKTGIFDKMANATVRVIDAAMELYDWIEKIGLIEMTATTFSVGIEYGSKAVEWLVDFLISEYEKASLMVDFFLGIPETIGDAAKFVLDALRGGEVPVISPMISIGIEYLDDAIKFIVDVLRGAVALTPIPVLFEIGGTEEAKSIISGIIASQTHFM